jgi:hypothetical protein
MPRASPARSSTSPTASRAGTISRSDMARGYTTCQTIPAAMPTARASAYRAPSRSLSTISVRGNHNKATAGIMNAEPDRSPLVTRRKRPRDHPCRVMARIITPLAR